MRDPDPPSSLGLAASAALAGLCLAVADAAAAVTASPRPPASVVAAFPVLATAHLPAVIWPGLLLALVVAGTQAAALGRRVSLAIQGACVLALGAYIHRVLVAYEPFRGHLPFLLALAAALVTLLGFLWIQRAGEGRSQRRALFAASACFVATGIAAHLLNYVFYRGQYATLHRSVAIGAGAFVLVGAVAPAGLSRIGFGRWRYLPLSLVALSLLVVQGGLLGAAEPYFLEHSELGRLLPGRSRLGFAPLTGGREVAATREDAQAPERFAELSRYPRLPPTFKLEDFNVLLIASEATRFDATSLAERASNTTPFLRSVAARAFNARRAFAPSSGTLHSMSALHTMKYPSAVALTTWMQPWYGELAQSETTVAELFSRAGYTTWWIGHDHRYAFERAIVGLNQGFERVELVPEEEDANSRETDERVASLAIVELERFAGSAGAVRAELPSAPPRFFGWIFFASPHGPYVDHSFAGMPSATEEERYLQEVRNVDLQFERVWSALTRLGLLENTVVIYLSDHGEEFYEHGGTRHKATVYTESLHVPLLVWVPGLAPTVAQLPTSTLYVFPWLMASSQQPELQQAAARSLNTYIGPMLRETGGAVVSELIGHDRIKSTLIYPHEKLNYDHRSGLFELYRTERDPLEQRDVFLETDSRALLQQFAGYHALRQGTLRHRFEPTRSAPQHRR